MKKLTLAVLAIIITLGGCAVTQEEAKKVTLPDGKQGYYISCWMAASDWTACYEQAAKTCNGKYKIVDKNETNFVTPYGSQIRRNMIVGCDN